MVSNFSSIKGHNCIRVGVPLEMEWLVAQKSTSVYELSCLNSEKDFQFSSKTQVTAFKLIFRFCKKKKKRFLTCIFAYMFLLT